MANFWQQFKGKIKKPVETVGSWFKKPEEKPMTFEVGAGLGSLQKKAAEEKIEMMAKEAPPKPTLTLGEWLKPTPKVRVRDVIREMPEVTKKIVKGGTGFLKTIQEEIAKSGASVGLTLTSPITGKKELTSEELGEGFQKQFKELIFGKEPLKAISTRIAEAELTAVKIGKRYKIKPFEKYPLGFGALGVGAVIGLDFTGWGAGKSGVIKILAKMNKVDDVVKILKKVNVADDLIPSFSKVIAETNKADEIAKILNRVDEIQKTTKIKSEKIIKAAEIKPTKTLKQIIKPIEKPGEVISPTAIEAGRIKIIPTEKAALKAKLRAEARGARIGVEAGKREMRKKLLSQIADRKEIARIKQADEAELKSISQKIQNKIAEILNKQKIEMATIQSDIEKGILKNIHKERGLMRTKISYQKLLGEFNQTPINEIKKEFGILKPLRKMNTTELEKILNKMKERLAFKKARGFVPKIEAIGKEAPEITEEMYEANRILKGIKEPKIERIKKAAKEPKKEIENIIGVISTRLENIDISLKRAIRRMEYEIKTKSAADKTIAKNFLEKAKPRGFLIKKGMSKTDWLELDLALKNGKQDKVFELAKKYKMENEYLKVKDTLDDLYKRANDVGYELGYEKNYWPRIIKDPEGFLEFIMKRDDWSKFDAAIKEKEMILGRVLDADEKAYLINTAIRGYGRGQVALSKTAAMKERVLDFISPELNQFYLESDKTIISYIDQVNDAIEARKFFGKHIITDVEGGLHIDNSIGAYVMDLMAKGKITVAQEKELTSILRARFNPGKMGRVVGPIKNLSYITVMGSPYNAITQIGDLAFSIYSGGLIRTITGLPRIIIGKAKIKKADLGIERIASEFADASKGSQAVNKTFKIIGLDKIDAIGKESLINSTIRRLQHQSKNIQKYKKFMKELTDVFGDKTDDIIRDLQRGEITDDVKYLAFNKLLDFQPVALSEVPEQYLKSGNGKIFYMLKTWTIKMMDIYRREAISKMTKKETFVEGFSNFLKLTAALVACEATADEIKDIILGREMKLSDRVIESTAKLFFASKWERRELAEQGLGARVAGEILPPTNVVDDVWKDLTKVWKNPDECFDVNDMRTVQNIPIGGKLYYWWFGKASKYKEKKSGKLPEEFKKLELELPTLPGLEKKKTMGELFSPSLPTLPGL